MLRIDFVFQLTRAGFTTGYGSLVQCLANADDSLFATELVKTLVMNFWDEYSKSVKRYVLLPFTIYFCSTVDYFSKFLIDRRFRNSDRGFDDILPDKENNYDFEFINRVVTIVFMIYFFLWECVQIKRNGFDYFRDPYNYLDIGSISLNSFLLFELFRDINSRMLNQEETVLFAFISVLILWWKMIYWFRLFASTSFYIKLIAETIKGVVYFMIIFVFILCAFANCIYILDRNRDMPDRRTDPAGSTMIASGVLDNRVLDTLLNQYLLALGEFGTDNFSAPNAPNKNIVWFLFVVATFIS
jgi:hypothetical protein